MLHETSCVHPVIVIWDARRIRQNDRILEAFVPALGHSLSKENSEVFSRCSAHCSIKAVAGDVWLVACENYRICNCTDADLVSKNLVVTDRDNVGSVMTSLLEQINFL